MEPSPIPTLGLSIKCGTPGKLSNGITTPVRGNSLRSSISEKERVEYTHSDAASAIEAARQKVGSGIGVTLMIDCRESCDYKEAQDRYQSC
jgi:hypothetical protein